MSLVLSSTAAVQLIDVDGDVPEHFDIYQRLLQFYECECSRSTRKMPDTRGIFAPDVEIGGDLRAVLAAVEGRPAGFAEIRDLPCGTREIYQFFVLPCFRRNGIGSAFACAIWQREPGTWIVKQDCGDTHASAFWRSLIDRETDGLWHEQETTDPLWGAVVQQTFTIDREGIPL